MMQDDDPRLDGEVLRRSILMPAAILEHGLLALLIEANRPVDDHRRGRRGQQEQGQQQEHVRARHSSASSAWRVSVLLGALSLGAEASAHPWVNDPTSPALIERVPPPPGFERRPAAPGSFAEWLRTLPIRAGRPRVHLFDGRPKANQEAHLAVIDIDVGDKNLQQCADAVMRLFAEHQWSSGAKDRICFRFTSGDPARWTRWRDGIRPRVRGSRVRWSKQAPPRDDYASFRTYLDTVFTFAGTHSLARDLTPVQDPSRLEAGDVFIQGGFPGHAVLVIDVAESAAGERRFLLAQSFMPAQEIHVLRNPAETSPWYAAHKEGRLLTPEWTFDRRDLRRFGPSGCGQSEPR